MAESGATGLFVVVDASVGVTLTQPEAQSDSARAALLRMQGEAARFLVPTAFWLEVVNVLRRRDADAETIMESVYELRRLGLESRELDEPLLLLTVDLILRHRLMAHDGLYLALAEATDARLLTADVQLADAAGARAVLVRPDASYGRVQEDIAPYRVGHRSRPMEVGPWPGAAAYIARLRERTEPSVRGGSPTPRGG